MADRHTSYPLACLAALCVLITPAAFGAQPSRRAAQDLAELQSLLAGHFATGAQGQPDADAGEASRVAVQRVFTPVRAGFIGDTVFYVQESVQGDARRILSQQLWLLEVLPGSALLVTSPIAFNEPLRWRDGVRSPELFRSILPQDVKAVAGCEVVWRKVVAGFDGVTDPARCRLSVDGGLVGVEQRYQLRVDGFTLQERRFEVSGQRLADASPLHFRRQAP